MAPGEIRTYAYLLDNRFFANIDGSEVQKGKVNVTLSVERTPSAFEMKFHLAGVVCVPCDRCLDDVEQPVEADNRLFVKFGREFAEESDEILVISEDEGAVNLAWFLYEFVALAVPMKHIHPLGKCNRAMASKLRKHATQQAAGGENEDYGYADDEPLTDDEADAPETDPRWDALKDLM
jgi:uncharacterized metal-binding protein YceD (DUF177 family)